MLEGVAIGLVDFAEDGEVNADSDYDGGVERFGGVFDGLVEVDRLGGGGGCGGGIGGWLEVVEKGTGNRAVGRGYGVVEEALGRIHFGGAGCFGEGALGA